MNFLDLFAGIGGFSLGLERAGMTCVGQVEIDEYCQWVLAAHWPLVVRYGDIRKVDGSEFKNVDLVCGGFPCQPFSCAGKRRGLADDRYRWPDMFRIIKRIRPRWLLLENVPGIVRMALDGVLADLEGEAYTCQPFIIPACAVDAPHRRDRVWIVAYSEHDGRVDLEITEGPGSRIDPSERTVGAEQSARSDRCTGGTANVADPAFCGPPFRRGLSPRQSSEKRGLRSGDGGASLADPLKPGLEGHSRHGAYRRESRRVETHAQRSACPQGISGGKITEWDPEPLVGRLAHGVPDRVVRLRALGNAVVPQVVTVLGKMILSADESTQ